MAASTARALHTSLLVIAGALATAATAQTVPPATGEPAPPAAQSGQLDDIVVTAERRSESIQRTPISVTALAGPTLAARQVIDTRSIISNAPNLTGNINVGQGNAVTFYIRGIGVSDTIGTFDPSVGLYVDDVYIARQSANNFGLYDLERVEVLRGPQGTLYGRNTNGGAVKIVTVKPDATLAGAASASYGNYNRWDLKASLNVPLNDKLFLRVNGLVQRGDGYLKNLTLNTRGADKNFTGGRVALRALLSDQLTWDLSADYQRDVTHGAAPTDIAGVLTVRPSSLFETRSGMDNYSYGKGYGFQSDIGWVGGSGVSIDSITAYRTAVQILYADLSGQPVPLYVFDQHYVVRQFSQELKLNADLSSRLHLLTGLYYFNERNHSQDNQFVRANAAATQIAYRRNFFLETNSYAAYGQLEYALTDTVKLSAAARYTHDKKTIDYVSVSTNTNPLNTFTDETIDALGTDFDPRRTFSKFTPKLNISWQATPDAFFYASYTKGFRSGGWTGRALRADQFLNYNPENVDSYEIGSKLSLFGRTVRFNNSIFYMNYTNLFNTLTVNGLFVVQLADARIYGLESEATIRVNRWLDLFANGGYLHTEYKDPRPVNLQTRLQRSPRFQGKAGFSAHHELGEGSVFVDGDVFYSGTYYVTPANLAFTSPTVPVNSNKTPSFALVNGSIGYEFGQSGRYRVSLSCTNCLKKEFFDSATIIGSYAGAFATTPRMYKVSVGVKF